MESKVAIIGGTGVYDLDFLAEKNHNRQHPMGRFPANGFLSKGSALPF